MALLESPDDPDDLWQAVGDEVPAHRLLMQGDVILTDVGPLLVVTHACSMRRGAELHGTQMVAPIEGHAVPNWDGSYDWMPVPGAPVPEVDYPAGLLRVLRSIDTSLLVSGDRIAVMSNLGIQLLQQRLAHHLTRVVIETAELAEHCAPILAEAELHEDWLGALGADAEPQFNQFLDSDGRKLRSWLADPAKRSQAMTTVRREIRQRRDG
ncbi:MAG: hypothetical protein ACT4PW_03810 [Acidimicrobiia bacterium]